MSNSKTNPQLLHRFPDQWMGDVRRMIVAGIAAFVAALGLLALILNRSTDAFEIAMAFRIAEIVAFALGAAGIFVVVVDATRNVAEWRYESVRDWGSTDPELIRRIVGIVQTSSQVRPGESVPEDHPTPERYRRWLADAPAVHDWANRLAARLDELGMQHPIDIELMNDLTPPTPTEQTLLNDVLWVTKSVQRYAEVRSMQKRLYELARNDTETRRAVFALAPYALTVGIGIGLASMLMRPLT